MGMRPTHGAKCIYYTIICRMCKCMCMCMCRVLIHMCNFHTDESQESCSTDFAQVCEHSEEFQSCGWYVRINIMCV